MSKFKVGDKVRVTASEEELEGLSTNTDLIKTGEVYTVVSGCNLTGSLKLLDKERTWVAPSMIESVGNENIMNIEIDVKKLVELSKGDFASACVLPATKVISLEDLEEEYNRVKETMKPKTGRVLDTDYAGDYWYVSFQGDVNAHSGAKINNRSHVIYGPIFYDKESAEQYKRWLELDHTARVAMAESWDGEKADWEDGDQEKWCVIIDGKNVVVDYWYGYFKPYHFRTKKDARAFIDSITHEEAKLLIKGV